MLEEAEVDYEQLLAQYQHDLFHLLRGHRSLDYLEIWVPDEDHVKSLLSMVEAAQSCGRDRIVVALGPSIVVGLETSRLLGLLAKLGTATIDPTGRGMRLTVSGLNSPQAVISSYRRELDARSANLRYVGTMAPDSGAIVVHTTLDGVDLFARLDANASVVQAKHNRASGDACSALDAMCTIMQDRPLQEAAEHGVIRLEAALRDRSVAPPMLGIINATAAEPAFVFVQGIVRKLYGTYLTTFGARAKHNTFTDAPATTWVAQSPEAQLRAVARTSRSAMIAARATPDDVRVLRIEQGDRVMIAFHASVPATHKARLALAIEVALQTHCDGTLQVFLTDLKDDNAARRL